MKWAHPFDVLCVTLVATALLPFSVGGRAAVWTATFLVAVLVMRRRWRTHATMLSRATMLRTEPLCPEREKDRVRFGRDDV
jgi:hypothetical protein